MTHRGPFQPLPFCRSVILCSDVAAASGLGHVRLSGARAELAHVCPRAGQRAVGCGRAAAGPCAAPGSVGTWRAQPRGLHSACVLHGGAFAGASAGAGCPFVPWLVADGPGRYPPSVPPRGASRSALLPEPGDRGADQDLRRADSEAGKGRLSLTAPRPALCTWPLSS